MQGGNAREILILFYPRNNLALNASGAFEKLTTVTHFLLTGFDQLLKDAHGGIINRG